MHYVLLFALICFNTHLAMGNEPPASTIANNGWLEERMSLDCNGHPLEEVLEDVATFFKTEIVYQAEGAKQPVQCHYVMATVEQILDRLFKKQNRAILIELVPKKKIIVQVFGVSEYNIVSNDGTNKTQSLPFLGDMTNESLAAMQKEQFKKYLEELQNPDAIIPGLELTRAEITKLHLRQIQQHDKNLRDPSQNVAGTAMTQQQLSAIQKQQLNQYEKNKQDQVQVDPFTGLTTAETAELHRRQIQQ